MKMIVVDLKRFLFLLDIQCLPDYQDYFKLDNSWPLPVSDEGPVALRPSSTIDSVA